MSESANNICSCEALQQMRSDKTLYYQTDSKLGWLIAQVNDGTGINDDAKHREYTTIKFCPFCGGEISWNNW
jgi:hypothetical protein